MAKKRNEEWQIDEWDDTLDQSASSPKNPSVPANSETWNTTDDWDSPVQEKPPQRPNWKWIAAIGSIAAILVLTFVLLGGNLSRPDKPPAPTATGTVHLTKEPEQITPEPTAVLTEQPATSVPVTKSPEPSPTATSTPTEAPRMDAWYGEEKRYFYQQLSGKEKECFRVLYTGVAGFRKQISMRGIDCPKESLERVMFALRNDCPELFQISGDYTTVSYGIFEDTSDIEFEYRLDQEQYEARSRRIREIADEIRSAVPELRNEYEVEKAVYKWIIVHSEYLVANDKSTAFTDSVLIDGKAQCAGYSEAMCLLLRMLGVQCIEVRSVPEQEHQWNMVNIQGEWYQCDATWDDQKEVPAEGQINMFSYLNVPDRLMTEHTPEKESGFAYPACDAIAANYAYREGIYIPSPDKYPDTAGRINAEIQRAWISGHRKFLVMLDKGFSIKDIEKVRDQIRLPEGSGQYYSYTIEETHCLYIVANGVAKIHFIDVGQGDAILALCGGESLLIDAGPAEAGPVVNRYLKETLKTNILNYVIATHEHDDHIGGMPAALEGFQVEQIWSSPAIPMSWWLDHILPVTGQQTLRIEKPAPLSSFMLGSAAVTFINTTQEAVNPNDLSLAVRIDNGKSSAILTADIETEAEMNMLGKNVPLKASLLKVAHHGGNTSSSEAFIRAVSPSIAIISVGKGNKHGHPHAEPLRCLEKNGVSVYRTDENGTIICTSADDGWTVEVKKTR